MNSKEGQETLFLYANESILVANEKGEIVRMNPSAEQQFGYQEQELAGKKIEMLMPVRYSKGHGHLRENYMVNPNSRAMGSGVDLYALRKDGTEFPVEISLSPYQNENGKFVIAFIIDITIRKQAEDKLKSYSMDLEQQVKNRTLILEEAIDELEKTKADLREALDKEKELNEIKTRFVSMASHEFRTPLTVITSSLSLIKKYGQDHDLENQERHIVRIKKSISRLTEILNSFLSLSKLEEGKLSAIPEKVEFDTYMNDVLSEMKFLLTENHQLEYLHSGDSLCFIDKNILYYIIMNLFSNAVKFSPGGGLIHVVSQIKNDEIKIAIIDSGIGIPQSDQQYIKNRFFRAQNASHIQGTGLGLNIVKRYLDLIDGSLEFVSIEGSGSTFTFHIPLKKE